MNEIELHRRTLRPGETIVDPRVEEFSARVDGLRAEIDRQVDAALAHLEAAAARANRGVRRQIAARRRRIEAHRVRAHRRLDREGAGALAGYDATTGARHGVADDMQAELAAILGG